MTQDKRTEVISHPGEILKEEFLDELDVSISQLAGAIDVTRARVNEIVRGKRGITADTALRFGLFFKTSPEFWMNLQRQYDLVLAASKLVDILPTLRHIDEIRVR
ncbi:MAG: addiction module antidote protein, HigA family [Alphaproteobacteria bacterium]|nr:MAG: addiction module antidote protein, HigA family [Alphaproteobacteria bacterium]